MLDSKILITLAGLLASAYAINSIQSKKNDVKENFGMLPSFQVKVDREVAPNRAAAQKGEFTSIQNNYRAILNPQNAFYTVPGSFQAQLAPRMFGGDYGANITYNLPSRDNLAVPNSPLDFANSVSDVKENFTPDSCNKGGESLSYHGGAPLMAPDYANGNFKEVRDKLYEGPKTLKASHANLPVGDMTSLNSLGQDDQPIVYDRYMFANRNSRLRSQGDLIRGDLPIAPINNGWFNVNVQPNIDLQQGAMNVLAGVNNETAQQLADLIYTTSGNSQTAIAGMNLKNELGNPASTLYPERRSNLNNVAMGAQYNTTLSAGMSDVNVVAFP